MATNDNLHVAKAGKNDEFYTSFLDIEKEMSAYLAHNPDVFRGKTILLPCDDPEWSNFTRYFVFNFTALGLKKLISTAYASGRKPTLMDAALFETASSPYDVYTGKIFTLARDSAKHDPRIEDLKWQYLEGDGDFRSNEVTSLRDEADLIITNPPFSLFREFLAWITEADKQFSIIGNMNALTYKEVFPLIKNNKVWLGQSIHSGDREFRVPASYPLEAANCRIDDDGNRFIRVKGVRWYTNIDHGGRHQPLKLMTIDENLQYSKHQSIRDAGCYARYDNYDAIEVPFTDAIPSDYDGVMGVPISFLDKYNPEQFEIVGCSYNYGRPYGWDPRTKMSGTINGISVYKRLLIQHRPIGRHHDNEPELRSPTSPEYASLAAVDGDRLASDIELEYRANRAMLD